MSQLDDQILRRCEEAGVTFDRLNEVLDGRDNWGGMVHSVTYLTVLNAVRVTWREQQKEVPE